MTINLVSPSLVGNIADLKTFDGAKLIDQHLFLVANLNSVPALFRWTVGLAGTGDDQLLVTPTVGAASGRFLRADAVISLKLGVAGAPWAFNTPNNTILATIPTGLRLHVFNTVPEIVTPFAGLDTGSVGLDSNVSLNPGGLAVIAALLGAGFRGAMGAEIGDPQRTTLVAGDTLRHNLISAGYTGGTGWWHVCGALLQT